VEELVGNIGFYSATYRLFKVSELEQNCENYGQAVIYKGTVPEHQHLFVLDYFLRFETNNIYPVCSNTFQTLKASRFAEHFEFLGNKETHFGTFKNCQHVPLTP